MPKISVIVPVYKVEQYLNRCIDSILNQTFKDFELILVDDGSPDNSSAICDAYVAHDNRIAVIHQHNQGAAAARNTGIEYAFTTDSEWITFIDSDDWVHPQYLEILYNTAIKNKVEICSCNYYCGVKGVEENYRLYKFEDIKVFKGGTEFLFVDKEMNTYSPCLRLYRKQCFSIVRFPVGQLFEDMRTIYKVLYPCKEIAYIKNKLYYYFYNENGASFSQYTIEQSIDEIKAQEEHLMFLFNNRYNIATEKHYSVYRRLVEKLLKNYNGEQVDLVYKHFCEITDKICSNKLYIKSLRKHRKKQRIKDLNNDLKALKKEKNIPYAILFYLKNYLKICFSREHI